MLSLTLSLFLISALSSWAEIVKFGQTKVRVAAPAKKAVTKKTTKTAVSNPRVKVDLTDI